MRIPLAILILCGAFNALAANFKIDTAARWPYNATDYEDGIHPSAEIYEWIGTNTAAVLLAAGIDPTKVWAVYALDSFSTAGNDTWQAAMRGAGFSPSRQIYLATNGYSFGRFITNTFPYSLTFIPPANSGTQSIHFVMGGVNPNESASYAENAEYTTNQFVTNHAGMVTRYNSSNSIVVGYTITGHISDANYTDVPANAVTYAQWKATINASILPTTNSPRRAYANHARAGTVRKP